MSLCGPQFRLLSSTEFLVLLVLTECRYVEDRGYRWDLQMEMESPNVIDKIGTTMV